MDMIENRLMDFIEDHIGTIVVTLMSLSAALYVLGFALLFARAA